MLIIQNDKMCDMAALVTARQLMIFSHRDGSYLLLTFQNPKKSLISFLDSDENVLFLFSIEYLKNSDLIRLSQLNLYPKENFQSKTTLLNI